MFRNVPANRGVISGVRRSAMKFSVLDCQADRSHSPAATPWISAQPTSACPGSNSIMIDAAAGEAGQLRANAPTDTVRWYRTVFRSRIYSP